jgi:hypothetical protein
MIPSGKGGLPMIRAAAGHLVASLAAAGHPGPGAPVADRIALVAVAVLAVGAFTVLQVRARPDRWRPPGRERSGRRGGARRGDSRRGDSRRGGGLERRGNPERRGVPDWRTPPSRYGLDVRQDEAPAGNEERYRPDWRYGYPPGREPGPRERGPAS